MPEIKTFRLPDVGEGLTEAEVVTWQVAVGDTVTVNQTVVEIETAKSLVELPSPFAGRRRRRCSSPEGQTVRRRHPDHRDRRRPAGVHACSRRAGDARRASREG